MNLRKKIRFLIAIFLFYAFIIFIGPKLFLRSNPQDVTLTIQTIQPMKDKNLLEFQIQILWTQKQEFFASDNVLLFFTDSKDNWSIIEQQWDISRATAFAKNIFDPLKPHSIVRFNAEDSHHISIKAVSHKNFYELAANEQTFHVMYIHEVKLPLLPPYYWVKHAQLQYIDLINNSTSF